MGEGVCVGRSEVYGFGGIVHQRLNPETDNLPWGAISPRVALATAPACGAASQMCGSMVGGELGG